MAKHLFRFKTDEDYNYSINNSDLPLPNICVINDSRNVYINGMFSTRETAVAGDIIGYKEVNGVKKIAYIKPMAYKELHETEGWIADAIVVVPYSHTNNTAVRAMALKYGSIEHPENGSDVPVGMRFGDDSTILRYDNGNKSSVVCGYRTITEQTLSNPSIMYSNSGCLPAQLVGRPNSERNPIDEKTVYINVSYNSILPSPYARDGGRNNLYYGLTPQYEYTKVMNALNSVYDHRLFHALYLRIVGPKTGEEMRELKIFNPDKIYLDSGTNNFPAVFSCMRFSSALKPCRYNFNPPTTIQTNILSMMPWYCPTLGEMGYLLARLDKINLSRRILGLSPLENTTYLCSTTAGQSGVPYTINLDNGYVINDGYMNLSQPHPVIPFCEF